MNIKRIIVSVIACILMLSPVLVISAEEDNFKGEVGHIELPYASPVIDGSISLSEGWSDAVNINSANMDGAWNGEEIRVSYDFYRAWDDNGLYYAADITVPELILSTGTDDIDLDRDKNLYGYNGDIFILTLDPFARCCELGFGSEANPWYCIGIFDGNITKMFRTQTSAADITGDVKLSGSVTDKGWRFEAFIPWDIIVDDINDITMGEIQITKDEIAKAGNLIMASAIYQDRFYDPDSARNDTYSRYITICTTLPDGTPGVMSSAYYIKAYGIRFDMTSPSSPSTPASTNTSSSQTNASGVTTTAAPSVVQSGSSVNAAQTFDAEIAIAVFTALTSVTGIVYTQKKKK